MYFYRTIVFIFTLLTLNLWDAGSSSYAINLRAEPKYSEVVYDENTGSYFQYVLYPIQAERTWETARREAERLTHKGITGRLAVISNQKTGDLLRRTFKPKEKTWIGLRYFCKYRKLLWVNSHLIDPTTDYQIWDSRWFNNPRVTCETVNIEYMPVYYTSVQTGFRWQASGNAKGFYGYFVEYPKPE